MIGMLDCYSVPTYLNQSATEFNRDLLFHKGAYNYAAQALVFKEDDSSGQTC